MKALAAGKHVLVEKPIASTPDEALKMHLYAEEKGLVLLEGMHIRSETVHLCHECTKRCQKTH